MKKSNVVQHRQILAAEDGQRVALTKAQAINALPWEEQLRVAQAASDEAKAQHRRRPRWRSRSGRMRTCARIEANFPNHPRLQRVPSGVRRGSALAVWMVALCYSRAQDLEGFCPMEVLGPFGGNDPIQDLVDVGLFARSEEDGLAGVLVVNYAQFNGSKAKGRTT